ncbi:uncharacterized protein BDZ99DRAFT_539784 [Mytilinidion resinicola]|uniref:BTB domain-containing protein n=1 Tax=Mytilinidion resinicola TaxID=574789 RepID=A0A6A6Y9Z6_9PEZI|nr:uncharacterized protein BDZ99DRAFT_539784 [Mytilinidion resinicola]KAF2805449.1 hypothetical protein BDZ99DRAFT_539784 [Mytilinidion resinicola]
MPDPSEPAPTTSGMQAGSPSLPLPQQVPSAPSEKRSTALKSSTAAVQQPESTLPQLPPESTPARPQNAVNQPETPSELDLDEINSAIESISIKDSASTATSKVATETPLSTALITASGFGSAVTTTQKAPATSATNQNQFVSGLAPRVYSQPALGATPITFVPYTEEDVNGHEKTTLHFQTITVHPRYRHSSLEELRLIDYSNSRVFGPGSSTASLQPSTPSGPPHQPQASPFRTAFIQAGLQQQGNPFRGVHIVEPLFPPAPASIFGQPQTTLFGLFQEPFSYGRGISGPMVTLQIPGSTPSDPITEQHIHLGLALQSPYLRVQLFGRLVHPPVPSTSTLKFDLETSDIIDLAVQFLYTGSVTLKLSSSPFQLVALRGKLDSLDTIKLCRLWLLAVNMKMPKLQNEAVRLLWIKLGLDPGTLDLQRMTLSSATIEWVYSKTAPDDALRRLVVTVFSIRTKPDMVKQGLKAGGYDVLSLEFWREAWMVDKDARLDVKDFYVRE